MFICVLFLYIFYVNYLNYHHFVFLRNSTRWTTVTEPELLYVQTTTSSILFLCSLRELGTIESENNIDWNCSKECMYCMQHIDLPWGLHDLFINNNTKYTGILHEFSILTGSGKFIFLSRVNVSVLGAFVRFNGPRSVDTILFKNYNNVWIANYSTCNELGGYRAAAYMYMFETTGLSIFDKEICVNTSLFALPAYFFWNVTKSMSCPSSALWFWSDVSLFRDELFVYKVPTRIDYHSAYNTLSSVLPAVNFSYVNKILQSGYDVCFVGDSQIRNLVNSLGYQLYPDNCFAHDLQQVKGVCSIPGVQYIEMHFPFQLRTEQLKNCKLVFINSGQWPASYAVNSIAETKPWTYERYRHQIREMFRNLNEMAIQNSQMHFVWIDTNPHTIMEYQLQCPPYDSRFPHVLDKYNAIALLELSNILFKRIESWSYFDAWNIAFPLFDLSYDLAHYQGPIGKELSHGVGRLILQIFCRNSTNHLCFN